MFLNGHFVDSYFKFLTLNIPYTSFIFYQIVFIYLFCWNYKKHIHLHPKALKSMILDDIFKNVVVIFVAFFLFCPNRTTYGKFLNSESFPVMDYYFMDDEKNFTYEKGHLEIYSTFKVEIYDEDNN